MILRMIRRALPRAIVSMLCGCLLSVQHARRHQPCRHSGQHRRDDLRARLDTIRPPSKFTSALKRRQLRSWWSYGGSRMRDYEEDHLIPPELGGAPADLHNLWPQPRRPADGWNAEMKNALERVLKQKVRRGLSETATINMPEALRSELKSGSYYGSIQASPEGVVLRRSSLLLGRRVKREF